MAYFVLVDSPGGRIYKQTFEPELNGSFLTIEHDSKKRSRVNRKLSRQQTPWIRNTYERWKKGSEELC
jgi:hypothetical protein